MKRREPEDILLDFKRTLRPIVGHTHGLIAQYRKGADPRVYCAICGLDFILPEEYRWDLRAALDRRMAKR